MPTWEEVHAAAPELAAAAQARFEETGLAFRPLDALHGGGSLLMVWS